MCGGRVIKISNKGISDILEPMGHRSQGTTEVLVEFLPKRDVHHREETSNPFQWFPESNNIFLLYFVNGFLLKPAYISHFEFPNVPSEANNC
jgi:hypothetical protein